MLSLSAIAVSLATLLIISIFKRSKSISDISDNFNKVGTTLAIVTAGTWLIIQDRDSDKISIEENHFVVKHGGDAEIFITIKLTNNGEYPYPLSKRACAAWLDKTFPSGNVAVENISQASGSYNPYVLPLLRIRDANTVSSVYSKGHVHYRSNSTNELIRRSNLPIGLQSYFRDDKDSIDDEMQPLANSRIIFWTTVPCKMRSIYLFRFEIETKRSWHRDFILFFENGFKRPPPLYSRDQALVDLGAECEPAKSGKGLPL